MALAKGLRNMVGLQSRAHPAILYSRELVESGYVGEVMNCHAYLARLGLDQGKPTGLTRIADPLPQLYTAADGRSAASG